MSLVKEKSIALYQSIAEANEPRVYKNWHASSISDCPRAHYFKRLGIKPVNKPTGAKIIRWGAGHKLEEELRPHIAKVWQGTTSNKRYTSKKWDLTGEFDNFTIDGDTLVEVKSVSDWAFYKGPLTKETVLKQATGNKNKWGRDEFKPMYQPYAHHLNQNHTYVLLLAEQGKTVKNIDFVYASLSGLLAVYHTKVDPNTIQWVKDRLILLKMAWERKEPPDCICTPDNELWGAVHQWCDFRQDDKCCSLDLTGDTITQDVLDAADEAFGVGK